MRKEKSNHGFGLAVFSIFLLATAFVAILYFSNALIASIIAFLSAIMATAAYFEARRADGPRTFTLTILITAALGAFIILIWSGNLSRLAAPENGSFVLHPPEPAAPPAADQAKKLKEMEKVIEELEKDSMVQPPDTLR